MKRHRGSAWGAALLLGALALVLSGCPAKMDDAQKLERDGNDFFKAEKFEKAVQAYSAALELKPGSPGLLVNRGNARMMLDDGDGALADHDAALEADPQFALGYANRGILKDRLGDAAGAIADYRQALELDPELGEGPSILKRILYNPPTETIKERLEYLEALQKADKIQADQESR